MISNGSQLPAFSLPDEDGNMVDIRSYSGKILVLYFYPKDETPGCTKEACSFRDSFQDFTDAGAVVVGVSADSPASHRSFKEHHRLPFTLLSDENNAVRKMLGVPADVLGLIPGRVTFIIDQQQMVRYSFRSQFNASRHITEAIAYVHSIQQPAE